MKMLVYLAIGLTLFLNWDKISGMFKKKEETEETN
jgi:hypothetical protein